MTPNPIRQVRIEGAALLRWWMRELRDLGRWLLERIVPRLSKQIVVQFRNGRAEIHGLRREGASEALIISRNQTGEWPDLLPESAEFKTLHGARTTIVLAPQDTLQFHHVVPQGLGRDLEKVLALQFERDLPLSPDQFSIDFKIQEHLSSVGKDRVLVLIAHRSTIEQTRELMERWNLRPVRITSVDENSYSVGDFLHKPIRFNRIHLTSLERRLFIGALSLAMLYISIILSQWTYERVTVGAELKTASANALISTRLLNQFAHKAIPARDLRQIMRTPDAADLLATLTGLVPTSVWVYHLRIAAPSTGSLLMHIGAFGPSSTNFVNRLEQSNEFGKVRLVSATNLPNALQSDRFIISASRKRTHSNRSESHDTLGP